MTCVLTYKIPWRFSYSLNERRHHILNNEVGQRLAFEDSYTLGALGS